MRVIHWPEFASIWHQHLKIIMTVKSGKYFDILSARKAYATGGNITETLRLQHSLDANTSEIIEIAYDLQAGTYIDFAEQHPHQLSQYTSEIAAILDQHIVENGSMLDIGTGELTTLSLLTKSLTRKPQHIYAFDLSWSRIYKGISFARKNMNLDLHALTCFVADMCEIPLLNKSINITTSSHALEPNGGKLKELLNELFRVTIDKLVLFEPCFECSSEEGKRRMERLGYIKNIEGVVKELGGSVLEKVMIKNSMNPLNQTACYVIAPAPTDNRSTEQTGSGPNIFSVPGTDFPLTRLDDFYFSNETGLCFPVLKGIPVLKSNSGILASALCK